MKTAPPLGLPGTQPEALIKEARRRQRRSRLAVGVAVVAVLGGAAGVAAGLAAGQRSPPRRGVASARRRRARHRFRAASAPRC